MKSILFIIIILGSGATAFAQTDKLNSGDSIRTALERSAISRTLIDLRDSMAVSLVALDHKIKKSTRPAGTKLVAAHKELSGYKDRVELDIKEISQTSFNSWTADSKNRIELATISTRREYKRICKLL